MSGNNIISKRLSELKNSEEGVITKVFGHGSFRKRIIEMGFVRGKTVKVIKNAPLLDPVEYEIMGYHVALRRSEAELIEISTSDDIVQKLATPLSDATFRRESVNRFLHEAGNVINVALVGNPNSGKTTLFNIASGSHERVGNYGGVTVDAKSAVFRHNGYTINIVDLPGTYSITEYTPEELYVREHILGEMPDVVINVIDASNIERNLFLTTQLIDMNLKVVIALNMFDELNQAGATLDYDSLGRMMGIPIVPTIASKNQGIGNLFGKVIDVFEDNEPTVRHIHINYGADIEEGITSLQHKIWNNKDITARYSSRYLAIKLLEGDKTTLEALKGVPNYEEIRACAKHEISRLEKRYGEKAETIIADAKYGFIDGALEETYKGVPHDRNCPTARIDRIMTHRYLGIPIFVAMMWLMFQATFTLGEIPAGWIEAGVRWLGEVISGTMSEGSLRDLIVDGIIGGVGGVLVFLPNILILFFFVSLMEDTGYMARAAFIMDKFMHKVGLHGKSFIPLLMGFGCNVPAIMATRTLESKKDRLLTMLIIPFMSCSARMPVYVLLISAFFASYKGLVLLSVYLAGIIVAVLSALMLKRILFKKSEAPFVMELPPYRIPTTRSVVRHMWSKGVQYLKKMGSVILIASVLIWALGHYPQNTVLSKDYDAMKSKVLASNIDETVKADEISKINSLKLSEKQSKSYIGQLGKFIEPVIKPLGFDWHIGVSLISGLAAKEIIVSSMAVLNGTADEGQSLTKSLQEQRYTSGEKEGQKVYTPLVAYTVMIFILLYFPCIAALAAIRREAGGRWAAFSVIYTTAVAWLVSFAVFQIGSLLF